MTDLELITAARTGDQSAWETLLDRYRGVIWRHVYDAKRRRMDEDEALSQALQAFMRCVRRFKFTAGLSFKSYLFGMVSKAVLRFPFRSGPFHVPDRAWYPSPRHCELQPNQPLRDKNEQSHQMRVALDAAELLGSRHRRLIEMRLAGYSQRDVGKALGVSESRVSQLQDEAVELLQGIIRVRGEV